MFGGPGLVDINSQDGSEKIIDGLSGGESVGRVWSGAITGGDVEESIGAEAEAACIMSAGRPGDDDGFGCGVNPGRVCGGQSEPRDASVVAAGRGDVTDVEKAIFVESRVWDGGEE